jgi:hypothetical protein
MCAASTISATSAENRTSERGVVNGGWLRYGSTTARGEIWIAGVAPRGPWLLSIDHPGVAAEPCDPAILAPTRARLATFDFNTLTALHAALDRVSGAISSSRSRCSISSIFAWIGSWGEQLACPARVERRPARNDACA